MGTEPVITGKDASSDASLLIDAGIPSVLFGPGQHKLSHTIDESVETQKVVQAAGVLALASVRFTTP
jgi:acetylornithine deacetylase/succinyl-diaminopimelate desuccinylase-like protein